MKNAIAMTLWTVMGLGLLAGEAAASGFALKEQSASALGNAFAGATAAGEDVTYMFFNPAILTRFKGVQTGAVLSFIAPQAEFQGGEASTASLPPGASPPLLPSFEIEGNQRSNDIAQDAFVPAFYVSGAVSERLFLGLGINSPFGLKTFNPPGWIGRYHALDSDLQTININPAAAWKVHDMVSLAVGFQAQYAKAELSNAIDFGTIGAAVGIPGAQPGNPAQDGFADLEGDDWGYGWNAGILIEPRPGTRFGASYRSKISHTLEGDVDFELSQVGQAVSTATGTFVNTGVKADLDTPENVNFGLYHEIAPRWAVMAEADWTRWNRFEDLIIRFDNAQPDSVTDESWENTWFYSLGVTWKPLEAWTFRAGVAYDESPVPENTRTPRIPDEDRTWLALGVGWKPLPNLSIDGGYTHIWVEDPALDLTADQAGNTFRGNLSGEYENAIDIVTIQAVYRF